MNSALRFNMDSELIPVRFFFDQTKDEHFFVLAEVMSPGPLGPVGQLSVLTFEHEDVFLQRVGSADLAMSDMSLLAASVIRSIGWEPRIQGWLELNFTEDQLDSLGLDYASPRRSDFNDIHQVF
jgi:hypothetical protein